MDYTTINPIQKPEWNTLIGRNTEASIFHTQEWAKVLSRSFNYKPRYLISKRIEESIRPSAFDRRSKVYPKEI